MFRFTIIFVLESHNMFQMFNSNTNFQVPSIQTNEKIGNWSEEELFQDIEYI